MRAGQLRILQLVLPALCLGAAAAAELPYLTVDGRTDGFGAQLHGQISCLLEARMTAAWTYVHTPFHQVEHLAEEGSLGGPPVSAQQLDAFANLGHGELHASDVDAAELAHRPYCHGFADAYTPGYELLRAELLRKFYANKKLVRQQPPHAHRAAGATAPPTAGVHVHIRRGDVSMEANAERFDALEHYAVLIRGVVRALAARNISAEVHVHSEGAPSAFAALNEGFPGAAALHLHLNESLLQAWYALGAAHVLVLSRSSFSYSAALYNEGVVVYTPFWHAPLPSWVVAEGGGQPQALEQAMNASLAVARLEKKLLSHAKEAARSAARDHEQGSVMTLDLA